MCVYWIKIEVNRFVIKLIIMMTILYMCIHLHNTYVIIARKHNINKKIDKMKIYLQTLNYRHTNKMRRH